MWVVQPGGSKHPEMVDAVAEWIGGPDKWHGSVTWEGDGPAPHDGYELMLACAMVEAGMDRTAIFDDLAKERRLAHAFAREMESLGRACATHMDKLIVDAMARP